MTQTNIAAYRRKLIGENSAATVEKYLRDIRVFSVFAGTAALTKEVVMAYKRCLVERGYDVMS